MGLFQRRYKDGRLSKDWYINYRIHGKQFKRRIGPNKKLAEQVLMDIELKQAKGDYLGIYEEKKSRLRTVLGNTWNSPRARKRVAPTQETSERCNG
jgi:hypothetical protein